MTILDSRGRYLADMTEPAPRPAGPWLTNADPRDRRGADVRAALAGEVPLRLAGVLRRIFNEDPVSAEELAELANGRRI